MCRSIHVRSAQPIRNVLRAARRRRRRRTAHSHQCLCVPWERGTLTGNSNSSTSKCCVRQAEVRASKNPNRNGHVRKRRRRRRSTIDRHWVARLSSEQATGLIQVAACCRDLTVRAVQANRTGSSALPAVRKPDRCWSPKLGMPVFFRTPSTRHLRIGQRSHAGWRTKALVPSRNKHSVVSSPQRTMTRMRAMNFALFVALALSWAATNAGTPVGGLRMENKGDGVK